MIFNGASTLGPALAGFGVAAFGYAGNFFLNGASFLAVLIALYLMRVPERASPSAIHLAGDSRRARHREARCRIALGIVRLTLRCCFWDRPPL